MTTACIAIASIGAFTTCAWADLVVYDALSAPAAPAAVVHNADRRYADDTFLPIGSSLTLTGLSLGARNPNLADFSGTFRATLYADAGQPGSPAGPGAVLATIAIPMNVPAMSNVQIDIPLANVEAPSRFLWTGWESDHTGPGVANLIVRGTGGQPPLIGQSEDRRAIQSIFNPGPWQIETDGAGTWGGPQYSYTYRIAITAIPAPATLGLLLAGAAFVHRRRRACPFGPCAPCWR